MDLGATICLARVPRCEICPLAKGCPSRGRRYEPLRKQSHFEGSFLAGQRPDDDEAVAALARDGLVRADGGIVAPPT